MKRISYRQTEIGSIGIIENGRAVTHLLFSAGPPPEGVKEEESPLLKQAFQELEDYLQGKKIKRWKTPLAPEGTAFQKRVWQVLLEVPYGESRTYTEVAHCTDSPKAVRAVGSACKRNPIPVFIPCHRVLGAGGRISGFLAGLHIKRKLLALEGIPYNDKER